MVTWSVGSKPDASRAIDGGPSRSALRLAALTTVATAIVGCSGQPHAKLPSAPVTVVVTSGGKPVTEGEVSLLNNDTGQGGGGVLDAEGRATITAVPLGEYTVTVMPPLDSQVRTAGPGPAPKIPRPARIPAKVQSDDTSPFRITIQPGLNEARFDLEDVR